MICPTHARKDSGMLCSVPGSASDTLLVALGKAFHWPPYIFQWSGEGYKNETLLLYSSSHDSPGVLLLQEGLVRLC